MKPTAIFTPLAAFALLSCTPPPDVPPPHFRPDPPYAPQPVDPYSQNLAPSPDVAPPQGPYAPPLPRLDAPTAPPTTLQSTPAVRPGEYPTARTTNVPNQVISPYPPNEIIDVTDFRSGQLARDPKTKQIFRVP